MPIHPLVGQSLDVYRRVRTRDGRNHVDVWHPDGRCIRLPVEWTDLALIPLVERPATRSTVEALCALCLAVEVLCGVDNGAPGGASCVPEHASSMRHAHSPAAHPTATLDDGSPHRGVGDARTPSTDGNSGGEA